MLAAHVKWLDDWFCHREVASGIHAIGEPRFHQTNWTYLIIGSARALLFDSGSGVRDIRPIVRQLTNLPVTCLPSHMHFDHTGNLHVFDDVAVVDLALLRVFEQNGFLQEPGERYLGASEGMTWTPVKVSHWWPVGYSIALGNRKLEIIHTPGHAPEHIALWDAATHTLLAADFIYPGGLYGQIAGVNLTSYAASAAALMGRLPDDLAIFGAHGLADDAGQHDAPRLQIKDLKDLLTTLESLLKLASRPSRITVNDRIYLLLGANS